MGKYEFEKDKHKNPTHQFSLNNFYYVIDRDKQMMLIFKKKDVGGDSEC